MDLIISEGRGALKAWASWAHYNNPLVGYASRAAGIEGAPREVAAPSRSDAECERIERLMCVLRQRYPEGYLLARQRYLHRYEVSDIVERLPGKRRSVRWAYDRLREVELVVGSQLLALAQGDIG